MSSENDSAEKLEEVLLENNVPWDYYIVKREDVSFKREEDREGDKEDRLIDKVAGVAQDVEEVVGFDKESLEEVVSEVEEDLGIVTKFENKRRDEVRDFYKVHGSGEIYDEDSYDAKNEEGSRGYEALISGVDVFVELDEARRKSSLDMTLVGPRSVLEIAGFRDEEAERRREDKRLSSG